ncbi:hypothetical protein, partial [Faecalispora jeddahensis]|uniref:hypothetical protein n=1 Tax=Faecalispora jeddahensis TaxID=1414721 RepID=UPI0028A97310
MPKRLVFLLLDAFHLFLHEGMNFFFAAIPQGICWRRACPLYRSGLAFSLLYAFDFSLYKEMFFSLRLSRGVSAGAGLAPRAGAGTYFR